MSELIGEASFRLSIGNMSVTQYPSVPIRGRDGLIGMGGRKMGKIPVRSENGEEKDWVDWNQKMFEDIREGMFEGMCIDEMIQWVEQKLKERR